MDKDFYGFQTTYSNSIDPTMIVLDDYAGKRSLLVTQFPTVLVKHIEGTFCFELKRRPVLAFRSAFPIFLCCVIAFMVLIVIVHFFLRRLARLVFKRIAFAVIASSVLDNHNHVHFILPLLAFTTSVQLGLGSENEHAKPPTAQ
ncbi:hypothetical protein BU17DRAFT_101899 [Hysterangium stoloniferum]|nr:hypothetical protein BU17DRAFT_101899 [Hysterangium stoloniferum]